MLTMVYGVFYPYFAFHRTYLKPTSALALSIPHFIGLVPNSITFWSVTPTVRAAPCHFAYRYKYLAIFLSVIAISIQNQDPALHFDLTT